MDDLENTNISWNFPQGTQAELAKRVDDILEDINYIKAMLQWKILKITLLLLRTKL